MLNRLAALQPQADKVAISLSVLCALHCLALPLAVALLPSLVAIGLQDEIFHIWIVLVVIPVSVYALTLGCRKHRNTGVLLGGLSGLLLLCVTALFGHDLAGESGERALTLAGALIIAASHARNFQLCRERNTCDCSD